MGKVFFFKKIEIWPSSEKNILRGILLMWNDGLTLMASPNTKRHDDTLILLLRQPPFATSQENALIVLAR
jgi:hypothetical protein